MRILTSLWLLFSLCVPVPAEVDRLFEKWSRPNAPGCALAVMKDGQIVYRKGYGMADLDHEVPITPTTVFHVASVSKQFTAAAIALLAQQGKLSLDDPVRKYIPELPDFGRPVTIRHLVYHTSGLRDQWSLLGLWGWRYSLDLITDEDVMYVMARQRDLNFPPGDRHLYSNTGYTLMALIVKKVSGQTLREFTSANFFAPLGMKNTHFRDDHAEIVKNMAYGYVPARDTFKLSITNFDTTGATSLLTTVEDLARWDENFYTAQVGGKGFLAQLLERGKLNSGEQIAYAFGLTHAKYRGLTVVEHSGGDAGYRAHLMRFPDQHFSVACLCNTSNNPGQLSRQVADHYLGEQMAPKEDRTAPPEVKLPAERLAAFAGVYHLADGDVVRRFAVKDGALHAAQGENSLAMRAVGDGRFRLGEQPVEFRFEPRRLLEVPDAGGKPTEYARADEFQPGPAQLQEYAGTYQSPEIDPAYRVSVKDGKLVLDRLKNEPARLQPALQDLFTSSLGSVRFTRDAQGRVSGFVLNAGRVLNVRFPKVR